MKLELRKAVDGMNFVICICGSQKTIAVPLSPALSHEIARMASAEGVKSDNIIRPMNLPRAS